MFILLFFKVNEMVDFFYLLRLAIPTPPPFRFIKMFAVYLSKTCAMIKISYKKFYISVIIVIF